METQQEPPTVHSSRAEVWYLKEIKFHEKTVKIITQNFNGPCSFIAICNILILRGDIEILPAQRETVSYEFLAQLVAEYLLTTCPDVDISDALSIMPYTQKGLDLNPLFTSSTSFCPSGTGTGELTLFEQARIPLVHGWLVDPNSPEYPSVKKVEDYDTAVNLIAEADHITDGKLVGGEDGGFQRHTEGEGGVRNFTVEERRKIEDALQIRQFINSTWSQLTYHGLFHLSSTLLPGSLVALFRSSHLSVLYKPPAPSSSDLSPISSSQPIASGSSSSSYGPPAIASSSSTSPALPLDSSPTPSDHPSNYIYTLVTDQVFLNEPTVVWERVEDVEIGVGSHGNTFVDSAFIKSSPAGGDFAGQTAEETLMIAEQREREDRARERGEPNDHVLAQQLQAEEDAYAREQHEAYVQERRRREQIETERRAKVEEKQRAKEEKKRLKKEKGGCVIM